MDIVGERMYLLFVFLVYLDDFFEYCGNFLGLGLGLIWVNF